MKMVKIICAAALMLACALVPVSAGTSFSSASGSTNALNVLNTNIAVFPSVAGKQLVLYGVSYRTATNATLTMATATSAFYQTSSNLTATTVTNRVNSTNGFVPGGFVVLEHNGTPYVASLVAVGQSTNANSFGTNIVLGAGGWGVATAAGDNIYQLDASSVATVPLPASNGTNQLSGSAIFVGNPGRPVVLMIGPALTPSYMFATGEYR